MADANANENAHVGNDQVNTNMFTGWMNKYFGNTNSDTTRNTGLELTNPKKFFHDMGIVVKEYTYDHLSVFNTTILPTIFTDKIETRYWIMKFDKTATSLNPIGGTADKSTYTIQERYTIAERHGRALEFALIEFMTADGRSRIAKCVERMIAAFVETTAMYALLEIAKPEIDVDPYFYLTGGMKTERDFLEIMDIERREFACSIKSEHGLFEIYKFKKSHFSVQNAGVLPDVILMDENKEGLFKFGNQKTNEYYRGGTETAGMFVGSKIISTIDGVDVISIPTFPSDAENGALSLLSRRVSIGNACFYNEGEIDLLEEKREMHIYVENADGPVRVTVEELLDNCGYFDPATGNLEDSIRNTLVNFDLPDVFINDGNLINTIGRIHPKYLTQEFHDSYLHNNTFRDYLINKNPEDYPAGAHPSDENKKEFIDALPITKQNMNILIRLKVRLPFTFLIFKPRQQKETSPSIMLKKGSELGNTLLVFQQQNSSYNAKDQTAFFHDNRMIGAVIRDPYKRCHINNAFIQRSLLGNGAQFVNDDSYRDYIQGIDDRDFGFMVACVPLKNNQLDHSFPWFDLCGNFSGIKKLSPWVGSGFLVERWQMHDIRDMLETPQLYCLGEVDVPNRVCYWGSWTNGPMSSSGLYEHKNMGHMGPIESAGDAIARRHGNQVIRNAR